LSKESREIKVNDKRMFTADGELREEYRFLEEKSTPPAGVAPAGAAAGAPPETGAAGAATLPGAASSPPPPERTRSAGERSRPESEPARREPSPPPQPPDLGNRVEIPGAPRGLGPTFYDLAAMLAEPVSIYLGDLELPDGQTAENLEMARLHIDLLDVLRQKTAGNLSAQESAFMEDLLYRLRVRYVQKRG
jgi:hypothetical protein